MATDVGNQAARHRQPTVAIKRLLLDYRWGLLAEMNATIPSEVSKTITRLRADAKEKNRLADDLERIYTGEDPKQSQMAQSGGALILPDGVPASVTVETLVEAVRKKGGRTIHLAKRLKVSEERIKELVATSNGKLFIPDWRGWVKLKHK